MEQSTLFVSWMVMSCKPVSVQEDRKMTPVDHGARWKGLLHCWPKSSTNATVPQSVFPRSFRRDAYYHTNYSTGCIYQR